MSKGTKDSPYGILHANAPIIPEIDSNFETRVFAPKAKLKPKEKGHTSKFINIKRDTKFLDIRERKQTLQDRKKEWKDSIKPRNEVIDDKVKIHIPKKEKEEFLDSLHDTTDSIYQFFMKEIIPIYAAIDPALEQVVQNVSHILKTEAEIELDSKVFEMMNDVIVMKIFEFASDKFVLSKDLRKVIRDKYFNPSYGLVQGLKKNGK